MNANAVAWLLIVIWADRHEARAAWPRGTPRRKNADETLHWSPYILLVAAFALQRRHARLCGRGGQLLVLSQRIDEG
jgi:hypothetical protein